MNKLQKERAALIRSLFAVALVSLSVAPAFALNGQYMGLWATDKQTCNMPSSPERWLLQQTDLITPQFRCKLLGLRQDNSSGMIFMASCRDVSTKWNDEIAIKASGANLSLTLKSDGQERQFVRCS